MEEFITPQKEAAPVKIVGQAEPIAVKVEDPQLDPTYVKKEQGHSLAPTTTEEEDVNTAGQRKVNLIWEYTQAIIALLVCIFTMVAALMIVIAMIFYNKREIQIPTIFAVAFGTVIGFYFSRTNHTAIGGVGLKRNLNQKYEGR